MRLSTLFAVTAVLGIVFGLSFVFASGPTLALYGIADPTPGHVHAIRWFGIALISLGVLDWLARGAPDSQARRAIVSSNLVHAAAGVVLGLLGVLQGTVNAFGWTTVVIYAFLLIGFGLRVLGRPAEDVSPTTA